MSSHDTEAKLQMLRTYLWATHERDHKVDRRAAPEPWRIQHEEGQLVSELKRHLSIVQAYDWHMLAAAREQASMRTSIESVAKGTCYFQADFSENIGVPLANEESSDMWHGAARKTLSVFGVYLRQWEDGQLRTKNILYVSEVLEKSSLFATLLIRKAVEEEVVDLGRLKKLLFVFDAGNHFRSYEQAHNTMVHIPVQYSQPCVTRYMVEKHGKGPCDSQLFSPMRRFLKQACMQTDFFAQDENDVVRCLQKAAAQEAEANPDGPKWIIKVPDLPDKRPSAKVLTMLNCQINRSYCFETVLSKYSRTGVEIRNWIFSDASQYDKLQFHIQDKAPEFTEWKSGYFQNPTWQQPALELGEDNAITRKWQSQKHRPSSHRNMQALPARSLAVLQRRDENRLNKALQKRKQKYKASKKERDNQSDVSLWEKNKAKTVWRTDVCQTWKTEGDL